MSDDEVRQTQFAERMLGGLTASAEILTIDLGRRLGLYQALAGGTPTNAEHLGIRAGIAERYAREWLEQQAAAGILDVVPPDAPLVLAEHARRRRAHREHRAHVEDDGGRDQTQDDKHSRRRRDHPHRGHSTAVAGDVPAHERHRRRHRDTGGRARGGDESTVDSAAISLSDSAAVSLSDTAAVSITDTAAAEREYALPAALEPLLLDPEHPLYLLGVPPIVYSLAAALPQVERAYRTGDGVPYSAFGAELRFGIAALNRPGFTHELRRWVDALPDLAARLDAGGTALDAGCGFGWSTLALARAFPNATVIGVDLDQASVAEARANAAAAGLDPRRVRFETVDAAASVEGTVDLVTVFEALHDMGEPVRALASFRRALAPGGAVLVADEKVGDVFTAPSSDEERMQYAFSVLHCLPATMAESASVANGTVLRVPTVRRWAAEAGFGGFETLPVAHDFWRFYRLS
ncbi:class I SAM-dependent methyltransferase [Herbiconiux sp. CPCC 205763]|uniref:Class I SAM-dependent methyltransferase n=1 Tax=Herbiconiux aconitum TaxID=2970913 RepID=A0ABT2GVE6_9MICO|nr:class I SAM-dependent methyltransferase [Herbiconiux aconitum]MCS5720111.1 class I SAM-dependent methyltransferase [Herbiconiux aconitum]